MKECSFCLGQGACIRCAGSGGVAGEACPECAGTGQCPDCQGRGVTDREHYE